jgi:hypothetical protein
MTGSNLPPGVSEGMIPGNRPEDVEEEAFWEAFEKKFKDAHPKEDKHITHLFERYDEPLTTWANFAHGMGYEQGLARGMAEALMAESAKQEMEYVLQRCAVCGEIIDENPRAEVVLKSTQWLSERPHLIVHQEPCYNEETMEIA